MTRVPASRFGGAPRTRPVPTRLLISVKDCYLVSTDGVVPLSGGSMTSLTAVPGVPAGHESTLTSAAPFADRPAVPGTPRGKRRRLTTRGRLYVAVAALASWFGAGFLMELAGLREMERALAKEQRQQERMRLALEVEGALRAQYARHARILDGDPVPLGEYRAEKPRVARLIRELAATVDDPDGGSKVSVVVAAAKELDGMLEQGAFASPRLDAVLPAGAGQARYQTVFALEESIDALFGHLRGKTAEECALVDRLRGWTVRLAVVFLAGTPLLAAVLALYLSRSIARPLRVLGEGTARIAAGDLGTRIDAGGPQEFDVLAAKVNDMAASLARDREELIRARTLAGLGRMAAGIAHEFNNPLQVVLGYLTLHRGRVTGRLGRDLERVATEALRCRDIVKGMLKLSKPTMPGPPGPVDLRAVGEDVASAVGVALIGKAPAISVMGEVTALGVPAAVRQILMNLAKNAAEAAGAAGAVEIRVGREGLSAFVTVSDSGPGIAPAQRDHVFEPFFTTKQKGTGLGLSIARSMAGALGGELQLERGEGGARFTLRLPLANHGGVHDGGNGGDDDPDTRAGAGGG